MRAIRQWADSVEALDERYRPVAGRLRRLAEGYRSKAILALASKFVQGG